MLQSCPKACTSDLIYSVSLCFLAFAHTEPPYFTESLEPMEVTAGDAVCLKCQVAGTPEIKVSWFKADGKVRSSPTCKLEYTKGVACLKLSKATKSDIGEYTCKAENRIGSASSSCRLNVQGKTYLQQTEGQPVRFECRVAGSLPIEVSWLKDGKPLSQGEEFSMLYDDNTAVLQINNSEMRHSGEYTCVATNSVGSASCRAKLTLQGVYPPVFDRKLSLQEVTVGDSIELECHMTGSTPIKVTWSKDHKDIRSGGNYKISCVDNTPHLTILKADKSDTGRYFCHASNDMGKDSCSSDITCLTYLSNQQLWMTVGGDPIPSVKWMKGKWRQVTHGGRISIEQKGQEAKLEIKEVTKSDSGQYRCVASNKHGEIECSTDMHVEEKKDVVMLEGDLRIPVPTAKWSIEGEEITSQGNIKIDTDNFSTILTINECTRNHTGTYLLTVSNPAGTKTVALNVTVLDVPAAPIGPVNILEVMPDSMTIEWRPPKDDGGSPITNYIVEKRESNKETWGGVSSGSLATQLRIARLQKGVEYVVRIRAENKMGIGAPLESKPTVAEHSFMPPSAPGKPQSYDTSEDAVTLGWTMPLTDGGSQITGYIIERRHKGGKWIRVNKTPCKDLRYRVLGLYEGSEYEFRVFAENIAGFSGPSPVSDPCKPCRPITVPSKFLYTLYSVLFQIVSRGKHFNIFKLL
uniref:Uncharacterized protein n=1 Tax=Haplochromis burtoni TaxID=8153 RepID=A0A3Q2VEW6_HAPBU